MTARVIDPRTWSFGLRVPIVVVAVVLVVAAVLTQAFLRRLDDVEDRNVRALAALYLDGLSSNVLPQVMRKDVWEVYESLSRTLKANPGFKDPLLIIADASGKIIASSDPGRFRVDAVVPEGMRRLSFANALSLDQDVKVILASRPLTYQGRLIGWVYATLDVSPLLQARTALLRELVPTSSAVALAAALLGYLAIRRVLEPVRVLSLHLRDGGLGMVRPIPQSVLDRQSLEFKRLFRNFNSMALGVNDREAIASRLAAEERLSSLGRLASSLAHEINNPLGGLFNALDALRRHGGNAEARVRSLDLLQRGLGHVRDIVRAALVIYRPDQTGIGLAPADIDDLRLLVEPEALRKGLSLRWRNDLGEPVQVPASRIRQTVLNLLMNACAATPPSGSVRLHAFVETGCLKIDVSDDGPGLPSTVADRLISGHELPPPAGGLGLWIVRRLVREGGGSVTVAGPPGGCCTVRTVWPLAQPPASRAEMNLGETAHA